MGEQGLPSDELNINLPSGEMERREQVAADELIPQSPVIIRTSCSSRRTSHNDVDTSNIRGTWPDGFSLIRWAHNDRLMGGPRDPEAAAKKLWRKREKRLRRAQLESV